MRQLLLRWRAICVGLLLYSVSCPQQVQTQYIIIRLWRWFLPLPRPNNSPLSLSLLLLLSILTNKCLHISHLPTRLVIISRINKCQLWLISSILTIIVCQWRCIAIIVMNTNNIQCLFKYLLVIINIILRLWKISQLLAMSPKISTILLILLHQILHYIQRLRLHLKRIIHFQLTQ